MKFYSIHLKRIICRGLGAEIPIDKKTGFEQFPRPLEGLKIVVDAGNGAGGFYVSDVLEPLGADCAGSQFLDPDGNFPNHVPNPENKEAMESICAAVKANGADSYDFTLRETVTSEIIDDVARHRSEIGVLYLSRRNERAIMKILRKEELVFEELFEAKPHVFLGKKHPLAKKKFIRPQELDDYPYLTYEQGAENALYFAEEVMPAIDRKKNIRVRDRATMTNLVLGLDGFTIASGAHAKGYNPAIVSIPLKLDDSIRVGLILRSGIPLSPAGVAFVDAIRACVAGK